MTGGVGQDTEWNRSAVIRRPVPAVLVVLALAAACGGSSEPRSPRPAAAPTPVIDQNFADPDVVAVGGTYYAYATQPAEGGRNITMATSRDLKAWDVLSTDPLPRLPAWALAGRTWAPDVSTVAGGYIMYFTAHSASPDVQCIGVARSTSPAGPFVAVGTEPLVCPADQGGAIDPSSYVEPDGHRYLLWKNDGNCCGMDTWLQLQPLSADGQRVAGPARRLIRQGQPWEGNLVEAPALIRHGSTYVLFYSANDYGGAKYATAYATATRIDGPYHKAAQPLLSTSRLHVIGPGGAELLPGAPGGTAIVFHGWDPAITYRAMYLGHLTWHGNVPMMRL